MTQRRGLGRGLGALIPGAGATAPRGSDQDPELRTRRTVEPEESGPAAPAATGPRPVDMFFSGDPLPESAESRSRRLAGGTDLAGAMARAAAERRAATRTPARRRAAEATSTDKPAEESAEEASQPDATPRGSRRTSSSRSTASTSRSGRSGSAKTSSRSSKSEAATASSGTSSTSTSGSATSGGQKKSASAKTGSRKPTAAKTGSEKAASGKAASGKAGPERSAAAKADSRKPAAKTPSEKITDAPAPSSDPVPAESSSVEPSPVEAAPVAVTPSPDASAVAPASGPPEDRVEDSPIVDVEKVELTPAHPDRVAPAQPAAEQASKDVARESPAQTEAESEDLPVPPPAEPQEAESASDPAEAGMQDANREPSPSDEQVPDAAGAAAEDLDGLVRVPGAEFAEIPIHEIRENPRNPRTMFDDDALDELAFSLREVGVLQPVVVRSIPVTEDGESFELVMGERRWRAAQRAGLTSIPAIIRETSDDDLLRDALLENLHRTQLNPLEEAAAYQQLLDDFGCTQDELSARIGRSRPQISNTLRLMRLPALVQRRLASGALSAGHARALLTLEDPRLMEELAGRIVAEGLSVRAVERLVARGPESTGAKPAAPRRTTYNPRVVDITSRLSNRLEAPVRIDVGKRKGRITLEFTNLDDLERLVERLGIEQAEEHAGSVD